jgi:hypothetical protein
LLRQGYEYAYFRSNLHQGEAPMRPSHEWLSASTLLREPRDNLFSAGARVATIEHQFVLFCVNGQNELATQSIVDASKACEGFHTALRLYARRDSDLTGLPCLLRNGLVLHRLYPVTYGKLTSDVAGAARTVIDNKKGVLVALNNFAIALHAAQDRQVDEALRPPHHNLITAIELASLEQKVVETCDLASQAVNRFLVSLHEWFMQCPLLSDEWEACLGVYLEYEGLRQIWQEVRSTTQRDFGGTTDAR